jgi:hypothetical protein
MGVSLQAFENVWNRVRLAYNRGHCVSERGLQAVLYAELARELPSVHVVVEPCWSANDSRYVPDIAVVQDGTITDVFEIKFTPHTFAKIRRDISKLLDYGRSTREFPVAIDPVTGRWLPPMQISKQLRRHFVVVANRNAAAVWLESLIKEVPELHADRDSFFHWIGRIGAGDAEAQEWLVAAGA